MPYPKRLIEVDLPIKRISAHARREKSIRHGHISTLHIWWARRPLAACRAVLCAALWPDPADPSCPPIFRTTAANLITAFARKAATTKLNESCSQVAMGRWLALARPDAQIDPTNPNHLNLLRYSLLDFIADFANWDNSTQQDYLATGRALTQAAHEALGGSPGTRPLVVDPFAGGGAIPLEALRVGADAFASDLNPVAVLLNKVVLEYLPKYGNAQCQIANDKGDTVSLNGLAEMVRYWGNWIKEQAEKELAEFYPKDPDGSIPIAYLWARTVKCEGPGCGVEVPLIRSLWLAKKGERSIALQIVPDQKNKRVDFKIIKKQNGKWISETSNQPLATAPQFDGTVKRGSATCPVCGYTTPVSRVRAQLKERKGGANDARLFCVVTTKTNEQGRFYRLPNQRDLDAVCKAADELERRTREHKGPLSLVPNEKLDVRAIRLNWCMLYGITEFGDIFASRQSLGISTFIRLVQEVAETLLKTYEHNLVEAITICLGLSVDRIVDFNSSLSRWANHREGSAGTFGRQALPMLWDFAETSPVSGSTGAFETSFELTVNVLNRQHFDWAKDAGFAQQGSATKHPLPDDSVSAFVTDPPYYDAIPYAYLSDFFYVWLKRSIQIFPDNMAREFFVVPKDEEIIVDRPHALSVTHKNLEFYETELTRAFAEGQRLTNPVGIGLVVFASKTTSSWESILQAILTAGWTITGSWPIDTELATKVSALGQARLVSSVHIVCRPREYPDGSISHNEIGDWRDILAELPARIKEWMPRLMQEGVVGADAIFACLGPALEIYSRYEHVEKADGTVIRLREYLEHVWAAVGREALNQIFAGADTSGFEEDGRLTVLWLWTLSANAETSSSDSEQVDSEEESADEEEAGSSKTKVPGSFVLEYDTARKLAQGIGAHLEDLGRPGGVVEIKGDRAWLLAVGERRKLLLGSSQASARSSQPTTGKRKRGKSGQQLALESIDESVGPLTPVDDQGPVTAGQTTLDRIHQAMLLFNESRTDALKRLLVEDGVGRDQRFWRLAQALSALYPSGSTEKRWVDGVLARKKGLGL